MTIYIVLKYVLNNFEKRKTEHTVYDINNSNYFHRALVKYGLDNFKWEVIDYADTLDEINTLEKLYIEKYNTYKPNGYNMTKGGDGGSMWNARPVVCLSLDGKFISRYDSAGEAEKKSGFCNSTVLECCKIPNRTHKGFMFMFEDEYNAKVPRKYVKPRSVSMKKIIQCDINGNFISKYDSVTEASEITSITRSTISGVLTKKVKLAGGYIFVYENEYPIKDLSIYTHNKKGKKIAQVDVNTGEIIELFDRISDAGKKLGVNYKAIHKVVDAEGRTAYGYKWISQ